MFESDYNGIIMDLIIVIYEDVYKMDLSHVSCTMLTVWIHPFKQLFRAAENVLQIGG